MQLLLIDKLGKSPEFICTPSRGVSGEWQSNRNLSPLQCDIDVHSWIFQPVFFVRLLVGSKNVSPFPQQGSPLKKNTVFLPECIFLTRRFCWVVVALGLKKTVSKERNHGTKLRIMLFSGATPLVLIGWKWGKNCWGGIHRFIFCGSLKRQVHR